MRLLTEKRLSIATAESMTAGLVAHRLAQVPGASNWLRGGIVCYDNSVKTGLLGVSEAMIREHTAVSAPVAELLAVGVRELLQTDLGVSVVGYAGPDGGGPDKPVGTTFVGVAWAGGVKSYHYSWGGTRTEIQSRAAKMALNAVRLHLL